jgi:hypothetical protein
LISASIQSCKKKATGWNVDALVPILDSRLDVRHLFKDSLVKAGSDDLLYLTYSGNFLNYQVDSLFKLPDTTVFSQERGPIISVNIPPGTVLFSDTSNNYFEVKGAKLVYARILSGFINFTVNSNITEKSIITYIMPSATKDGKPLTVTRNLPASASSTQNVKIQETIDLAGYRVALNGRDNNGYNTIYFYFSVQLDPGMSAPTYNYGSKDMVTISNSFEGIVPYFAKGIFETQSIKPTDLNEESIDIFKNVLSGSFDLEKVKLELRIENEFGADMSVRFNRLTSESGVSEKPIALTGEIIGKSLNINRAVEDYTAFNPSVKSSKYLISVDELNSNADAFIENQPRKIGYDIDLIVNPLGNVSGTNDFVFSNSGVKAGIDLSIPLSLKAAGFSLKDTSKFEVGEKNEDLDRIVGGFLNIHCTNYYPFEAEIQINLLDADSGFVATLLEPGSKIRAAVPEENGLVENPAKSKLRAPVTPDKIQQFYKAKLAEVTLNFSTEGSAFRRIYATQYTEIKMVGDFEYNVVVK